MIAGIGGENGPRKPDGKPYNFTPYPPESENNDSNIIARRYLDSLVIRYRYIGATAVDMTFELFGEQFSSPIMIGGMSSVVTALHQGGMRDLAEGAREVNAPIFTGYLSNDEFARICDTGAKAIRVIKPHADNERILRDIRHDEECGAFAFALDVDHVFDDDGFPYPDKGKDYGALAPKTTEELKMLISASKLPCVIKGILSKEDAIECVKAGAAAILLSHHKGEMPCAVPPALVIPEIKEAVKGRIKVFAECGVVSGIDAFKVLARGADGVCAARTFIPDYIRNGSQGVVDKMTSMQNELRACMARTSTKDAKSFYSDSLVRIF